MINLIYKISFLLLILSITCLTACKRPPLPPPTVIFDQGHGQRSVVEKNGALHLSKLSGLFKEQGFIVNSHKGSLGDTLLSDIDALIISGPLAPLTNAELQSVWNYLNNGGQVCIMLHNAAPVQNLLASLQVASANGVVHQEENLIDNHSINFSVINLPKHPLTKDLKQFNIYGPWPLNTALEANIIAKTSKTSWVDLDHNNKLSKRDAVQSFPVLLTGQIGHGHFIVFGDDALFQNQFLVGDNQQLGRNLAQWFKEGSYY
jgi:hypothetical protein